MGAFGIFAAILTFIYVIYYSVMVSMDLFGGKSRKKDSVEIIGTGVASNPVMEDFEEQPTLVAEDKIPGMDDDKEEQPSDNLSAQNPGQEKEITSEDVESADNNELYQKSLDAMNRMVMPEVHAMNELSDEDYAASLDELIREQEAKAEEMI